MFFYVENYFPEKTYKKSIFIQTYNENRDNSEFVLQLDFKIDENLKNAYDIDFYYDERLFTSDIEQIIFDYYEINFDNKNIDMNKHQLSINSFKHDYQNLDIIFDEKTYLLRKIENFNGEKIKIFNQNYNLIYEKEYQPLKTIKKYENSEYITDELKKMIKSNFMLRNKKNILYFWRLIIKIKFIKKENFMDYMDYMDYSNMMNLQLFLMDEEKRLKEKNKQYFDLYNDDEDDEDDD